MWLKFLNEHEESTEERKNLPDNVGHFSFIIFSIFTAGRECMAFDMTPTL
jgi:hypothetical protein